MMEANYIMEANEANEPLAGCEWLSPRTFTAVGTNIFNFWQGMTIEII